MKLFVFRQGHWVALIAAALAVAVYGAGCWWGVCGKADFGFLVTFVGAIASAFYFLQKQKLDEVQVFLELFSDFNKRFEALCYDLRRIRDTVETPVDNEEKVLTKYLDLCCEEYYFRTHGTIYEDVWRTWCKGMLFFCEGSRIRGFFERELQKPEEYYGLTMEEIRRSAYRVSGASSAGMRPG
jgi:hypothetical protein